MSVELRILSTHAVVEALNEIGPRFKTETGTGLSIGYDPGKAIRRTLENGGACDAAIIPVPVFDALAQANLMLAGSRADIDRCGLGVAVRDGAPLPDISTPDAFRKTLLAAKSVVRSVDGTSGQHFETLLERFGITAQMRDKIVMGKSGRVAELVVRGEAELAVQQIPELIPVKGARYVGPYPEELQLYSTFCVGIGAMSQHREEAQSFIAALTTPAALAAFKAAGIEPLPK